MTQPANMMSLGLFVFQLKTVPLEQDQRDTRYAWPHHHAASRGPSYQFNGLDEDKLTLSGKLVPPVTGGREQLDKLRAMGAKGKSWNLVSGTGEDKGAWFIERVQETGSILGPDGMPREIQFTIDLKLAPDLKALGKLQESA